MCILNYWWETKYYILYSYDINDMIYIIIINKRDYKQNLQKIASMALSKFPETQYSHHYLLEIFMDLLGENTILEGV